MDIDRARAIVKSNDIVEVLYQGSPVWIENIKGKDAAVTYLETKSTINVPIEQLFEKKIVG